MLDGNTGCGVYQLSRGLLHTKLANATSFLFELKTEELLLDVIHVCDLKLQITDNRSIIGKIRSRCTLLSLRGRCS